MPVFPVRLENNPDYAVMLYPDIPFQNNLEFNPSSLQFPGDVESIGPQVNIPGGGFVQNGKLLTPVKVTFTRFEVDLIFPQNARVKIYTNADNSPKEIYLDTDPMGGPVVEAPAPPPPMGGGSRRRHRSNRRRYTRRHRRYTRRR